MIKSIVNTISTRFFTAVFNFLILLLTANYLGPEGRGQISLLLSTLTIVLLFSSFVGGNSLIFLSPRKPTTELLIISYLWAIIISLVCYLTLYISNAFPKIFCLHISVLALMLSINTIHTSLLIGKEKIKAANFINLFQVIGHFFLLAFCFLYLNRLHFSTFIYSLYLTYGLSCLIGLYFLFPLISIKFSFAFRGTLIMALTIGTIAQLANIFQFLNYRLDVYLLDRFDSIANLGIYSSSVSIAEAALLFGSSFALVQFSRIANSSNTDESRILTIKLTRYSTLLTLIAYLPLFVFPDEFYTFLLGKDFHQVKQVLFALFPGIFFLGSSVTISHFFAGIGNYKMNALASFIGLIISFCLGILFIPDYGFIAAAWISSISYSASTCVLVIGFIKNSNTKLKELFPKFEDLSFLQKSILNVRHKRNS
ncbi:MAG: polysaccharide biosynthesis C-terminal domain-containing protein [Bacteroidetes bacterium]|nr:polysaccharide biosynthesis C-terminal domain-containing protein [Bacteroidota bacterium]